ncbi:NgoFVII family restriction endonuclease [Psychromonas sp. psych-6C06]|nr:NgoFVII family restriction endonuclease [Psychromonas sp. psych-6C06]
MQSEQKKQDYHHYLQVVGGLSNLFSESTAPYLYYRAAERIFCRAFNAEDLSRGDVAIDAMKNGVGIGLKTFLIGNQKSWQKVAEFNRDRSKYIDLPTLEMVKEVARLRNARINFTIRLYRLKRVIYHCVVRDKGVFHLFEEPMHLVDIENIKLINNNSNSIIFTDGIADYNFSLSKSTLLKRFNTSHYAASFNIDIADDPLSQLSEQMRLTTQLSPKLKSFDTIYLPLYGRNKTVFERSGLNQWNANGRKRDPDEVYIPIPSWIHDKFPDFFPEQDVPFSVRLPSGQRLSCKLCQAGRKALMSNPNVDLGRWILRSVLQLEYDQLVNYSQLQTLGVDSLRLDKIAEGEYQINFSKIESYEEFSDLNRFK